MSKLIDLGCAREATRGLFPSAIWTDGTTLVEGQIRYRAADIDPDFVKVEEPV